MSTTNVSIQRVSYGFMLTTPATGEHRNDLAWLISPVKWSWTTSETALRFASAATDIRFSGCVRFQEKPIQAVGWTTVLRDWRRSSCGNWNSSRSTFEYKLKGCSQLRSYLPTPLI